jgi:hypothetical protein
MSGRDRLASSTIDSEIAQRDRQFSNAVFDSIHDLDGTLHFILGNMHPLVVHRICLNPPSDRVSKVFSDPWMFLLTVDRNKYVSMIF